MVVQSRCFTCERCWKIYKYRRGLWSHQKYECGKPRSFKCPYCEYASYVKSNLRKHVIIHDVLLTKTTHAVFRQSPNLNIDLLRNYSVNREIYRTIINCFKCGQCSKMYKYRMNLVSHQKYECGKPRSFKCPHCYSCNICSKMYKYRPNLSRHQKYECGKPPSFKCPHCEYACHVKSNLKSHIICRHSKIYE
ncbi:zinc finger protein 626-like [Chrysoperla carnea]|uniref:zinc finger protein 626-like n=1 Tax=Chrysoperla carnea TaxID=189513 RepID=UPI001D068E86|nr:zinc finger protein 626-like [Chrysoperla carnea]